jgi:hypothetical protein
MILAVRTAIAFLVGGGFIAIVSLLAERADKRTAGLILSLPSTSAIGLFFVGWTVSPHAVMDFAFGFPTAGGACYLFAVVYVYAAQWLRGNSFPRILLCMLIACIAWMALSLPMILMPRQPILLSIGIWGVYVLSAHYFLAIRPKAETAPVTIHFTGREILFRSIIAGTLIASVVVLSMKLGPLWGGLMSAFPAAISSTLLIVHRAHEPKFLFHIMRMMPAAAPVFVIYVFLAAWTFPRIGVIWGTAVTYVVSVCFLLAVHKLTRKG